MKPADARILVVDDEPDLRELYILSLVREGWMVDAAADVAQALQQLDQRDYAVVLTDMRLPDGQGLDVLHWLQSRPQRREKVIVITAYGSAGNAVAALKAGAFDYLSKPIDPAELRRTVHAALRTESKIDFAAAAVGGAAAAAMGGAMARMVGESAPMQRVKQTLLRVAGSMAPVLILGESGTGKELAARALHEASGRADGPFVAVNCSAIPEPLLEAEFFGYRKGAFTGAMTDHSGFFAAASGGTLFLDEIGELPLAMQAKLLRAVQERRVRPLGETAEIPVDVRLVSATHRDLAGMVARGEFRQDLFYRLNVIGVTLPPLRERLDDLPLLVDALLAPLRRDNARPGLRLTPQALDRLRRYPFPGNVRELDNLLHRAVALSPDDALGPEAFDLPPPGTATAGLCGPGVPPAPAQPAAARDDAAAPAAVEPAAARPAPPMPVFGPGVALPADLGDYIDQVERAILLEALRRTRFNRTAAAQLLGLNLRQMRYRMERLQIRDRSDDAASGDDSEA